MRGLRELSPAVAAFELMLKDDEQPLDLTSVFERMAPLEIDLGCGDGAFIADRASRHPERNFLGVERLFGRVGSACRRLGRMELRNVRILRAEIPQTVERLSPASVDTFHLLFPDPWPKRRHHVRRVFNRELIAAVARALIANGAFRIATDDDAYFEQMQQVVDRSAFLKQVIDSTEPLPPTTFEKRFTERGLTIHRLLLRKVSDPT